MFSKLLIAFALIAAVSGDAHLPVAAPATEVEISGSGSGSAEPATPPGTEAPEPPATDAPSTEAPTTTAAPVDTTVAPDAPSGSGSGSAPQPTEAVTTTAAPVDTTVVATAAPTEAGVTYREAQTFSTQIDATLAAAILALGDDDKAAAIKQLAEHALAKTELTYDDVESADLVESVVVRQRRAAHNAKTFTLVVVFKSSVDAEKAATAVTAFNAAVTAGDFDLTITVGGTEFTYTPGAATGGTKQVKDVDTSSATTAFVSASTVLVAGLVAVAL